MKAVKIMLTGDLHPELTSNGLTPGMIVHGSMGNNKAVYFDHFNTISCACVVYEGSYILIDPDDPIDNLLNSGNGFNNSIPIHDVESLFNPDAEEQTPVIKISDLNDHQKSLLNL